LIFGDLFWKRKIFDKRKFEKKSPNGKKNFQKNHFNPTSKKLN
jgi:hypothetical protein